MCSQDCADHLNELKNDAEISCNCQYETCDRQCGTPVDCRGFWSPMSLCSAPCGVQQTRSRTYHVYVFPQLTGSACPHENYDVQEVDCPVEACPPEPVNCVGAWSAWGTCPTSCENGEHNAQKSRTYTITTPAANVGQPCLSQDGHVEHEFCPALCCPEDCTQTFGDWTHCRVSVTGGLTDRGNEQGHLVHDGAAFANDRLSSGYMHVYSLCPDPTAAGTADAEFTVAGERKKWSVVTKHSVCGGAACSPAQTEACTVQCQMDCQHTAWVTAACDAPLTCGTASIVRTATTAHTIEINEEEEDAGGQNYGAIISLPSDVTNGETLTINTGLIRRSRDVARVGQHGLVDDYVNAGYRVADSSDWDATATALMSTEQGFDMPADITCTAEEERTACAVCCPVDCAVEFSAWSACSTDNRAGAAAGDQVRIRTSTVVSAASCGGVSTCAAETEYECCPQSCSVTDINTVAWSACDALSDRTRSNVVTPAVTCTVSTQPAPDDTCMVTTETQCCSQRCSETDIGLATWSTCGALSGVDSSWGQTRVSVVTPATCITGDHFVETTGDDDNSCVADNEQRCCSQRCSETDIGLATWSTCGALSGVDGSWGQTRVSVVTPATCITGDHFVNRPTLPMNFTCSGPIDHFLPD